MRPGLARPAGQPVSSGMDSKRAHQPRHQGPPWSREVFCTANVCAVSLQRSVSCYGGINEFIKVLCNCNCLKIPSMYIYVSLHRSVQQSTASCRYVGLQVLGQGNAEHCWERGNAGAGAPHTPLGTGSASQTPWNVKYTAIAPFQQEILILDNKLGFLSYHSAVI